MRSLIFLFAVCAALPTRPRTTGRHIIRLKPTTNLREFEQEFTTINSDDENVVTHRYLKKRGAFDGYAGKFTSAILDRFRKDERVYSIEEDFIGRVDSETDVWGLLRVAQRKPDYTKKLRSVGAAEGVTAFVLDTGIDVSNKEFEGRAKNGKNFIDSESFEDIAGHGTHVAGIIGSKSFGVAEKPNLVAVKICDEYGDCSTSNILSGLEYAISNAQKLKAVINMSLAVEASNAIDDMVAAATAAGIPVVVSAGNKRSDSCLDSPRRAKASFAVAATDKEDNMADFSNYGQCVKIFAPGVDILSVIPGGTESKDGTSMASPHVAGIMAAYMAQKNYTSTADVCQDVVDRATKDVVKNIHDSTVNALVYNKLYD